MQAGQASLSCQDAGQASLRLSYAAAPGRNKTRHAGRYNPSAAALAGDARDLIAALLVYEPMERLGSKGGVPVVQDIS